MIFRGSGALLAIPLYLAACTSAGDRGWRTRLAMGIAIPGPQVSLAIDAAGDVIAAGPFDPTAFGDALAAGGRDASGFGAVKLSGSQGKILWKQIIGTTRADARALVLTSGMDPIVGVSVSDARGVRFVVARLDRASGRELWRHTALASESANFAVPPHLELDPRGEVIAAGSLSDAESTVLRVRKLAASDGRELWSYSTPGTAAGRATAIATTAGGDPVVAAIFSNAAGGHDLALIKIDGLDGAEIWRRILPGASRTTPSGGVRVVALDRSGDVVAARLLSDGEGQTDLVLARLDGRNGALRWVESVEAQNGVALDLRRVDRNHLIAASASPSGFHVARLAASDGRQIWHRQFGEDALCGETVALRVDAADDVIAAGFGCAAGRNLFVVKLSGGDGQPRWSRDIGTATGIVGKPRALAVDPDGDVFVAGYATSATERVDLVILKLRGRDGQLPSVERLEPSRDAQTESAVSRGPKGSP